MQLAFKGTPNPDGVFLFLSFGGEAGYAPKLHLGYEVLATVDSYGII